MLTRKLTLRNYSFFIFGPRGVGKSTWLKSAFSQQGMRSVEFINLLDTETMLQFTRHPGLLYQRVSHLPPDSWVVLDEIQKVPSLLDEVHRLIEDKRLRFVLSGSSARKLKRSGVNLLAGRARVESMFPFVSVELGTRFDLHRALEVGLLPMSILGNDSASYLKAYAQTYLQEEIRAEALARNFGSFTRFLDVAARQSAQITNVSSIARDAQVARQTVQGYFDILCDTLMGFYLPAWQLKRKTKQRKQSKFYFFDTGVVRALTGRLPYPLGDEEKGQLLECLLFHELRAYLSYSQKGYEPHYWSSYDDVEVDLVIEDQQGFLGVEIKSATQWHSQFNKGLYRLRDELGKTRTRTLGIYLGNHVLSMDGITVYPCKEFLTQLWSGTLIV